MTEVASNGSGVETRSLLDAAIRRESALVVYHWRGWEGFLIQRLAPHAYVIQARPDDGWAALERRLPPRTGIFLFHINCSVTRRFPLGRDDITRGLQAGGWTLGNDRVVDISKRTLQARLGPAGCNTVSIGRDGQEDQLVVVKSNYNYGGYNERGLPPETRRSLGLDAMPPAGIDASSYRFMPRSLVPAGWWDDPSLAVERFVGNEQGFYFRAWVGGSRLHLVQLYNPGAFKKVGESSVVGTWKTDLEERVELPLLARNVLEEVRRAVHALDLTFGAIDVMVDDGGHPYVVDLNATPWLNLETHIPGLVEHLSWGKQDAGPLGRGPYSRLKHRIQRWMSTGASAGP